MSKRKVEVPGAGTGRVNCTTGTFSGKYLREVNHCDYKEYGRSKYKEKVIMYVDPWAYYDVSRRNTFRQPSRDWKRTKVKRQYMKNNKELPVSFKELNDKFL